MQKALEELGASRQDVEILVLSEGKSGIFGLGGEPARIRARLAPTDDTGIVPADEDRQPPELTNEIRPRREREHRPPRQQSAPPREARQAPPGAASAPTSGPTVERGVIVLKRLLELMGIEATVTARDPASPGDGLGQVTAVLDVDGNDDLGLLIGRRGETMASLQYIVNLILTRNSEERETVSVDVAGYRRRREESLNGLAQRMADRVRSEGRTVTLEPMPANERRIVHIALAEDPEVTTSSVGEGDFRKVALSPRR